MNPLRGALFSLRWSVNNSMISITGDNSRFFKISSPSSFGAYHVREFVVGHFIAGILLIVRLDLAVSIGKELLTFGGLLGGAVILAEFRLHGKVLHQT